MIDCAVQKAVQEPPDSFRVDAFIAIAEAQIENGDDAKSTLVQALDSADHITEAKEFSKDETGFALQVIAWEDIAFTQIRAGYFDDARLTMERLNIDINPDYLLSKVWTLTELAKTEAQAGLSLEEIKKMSQLDVQAIIGGDNELAKQALTFFKIEFMI